MLRKERGMVENNTKKMKMPKNAPIVNSLLYLLMHEATKDVRGLSRMHSVVPRGVSDAMMRQQSYSAGLPWRVQRRAR